MKLKRYRQWTHERRQAAVHTGDVFKATIAQIILFAGSDREELGNSPEVRNI